jgi:adenosine deaminase
MTQDPPGFQRFLDKFEILRKFYTSEEAVKRIAQECVLDAARDNILYLEIRFNPLALARVRGFAFDDVVSWVAEAVSEAEQETGVRTCLILQIPRREPLAVAEEIVDVAVSRFGSQLRGVDLAGNEVVYPPELFVEPFQRAFEAGLSITIHAGEAMGAESVQAAVLLLHPQRIGHGIRVIENSDVIRMLRERSIALEVCPTSNLHTGVVSRYAKHPLIDLANLQLPLTLNTDDPSVSGTTLTDEYVAVVEGIGLKPSLIYRTLRYSVEAAFLPEEEREALRSRFRDGLRPYEGALAIFDAAA